MERNEPIPVEPAWQAAAGTGGGAGRAILGIQPLLVSRLAAPANPAEVQRGLLQSESQNGRAAPAGRTNDAPGGHREITTLAGTPIARPAVPDRSLRHPPVFHEPPTVSRFADPASVALAAGIATAAPDGSIIFQPPAGEPVPPPEPVLAPLPVQRADDQSPAVTASVAPASPGDGAAGGDLDELARKLYPRIRPYLKKELWLDRERAGMLTGPGR